VRDFLSPHVSRGLSSGRAWLAHLREQIRASTLEAGSAEGFSSQDSTTWNDWREYVALVKWLVPDVYRHARTDSIGVLALSFLGVGARAATVASLLLYVHAQNAGRPVQLLGVHLPSDATPAVFLLWGGIALFFAVTTIAASYSSDVLIFSVGRSYMEQATRQVIHHAAAGREVDPLPEDPEGPAKRPITQMLVGDTFRLVRVVIQTMSVLVPLITLIVAVGVLIGTHALLTALLVPMVGVYSYLLGILNRAVMRDSQVRERTRRHHSKDVAKMLRNLERVRYPEDAQPGWLAAYPSRSWMEQSMRATQGIMLARKRVDYLGDAFQGVALLLVLMVFGTYIATEGTSWAVLLTYLISLGYAVRSMGRVSRTVTGINRYVPQCRRYVAFMQAMQARPRSELEPEPLPAGPVRFEATPPLLPGSRPQLEVGPGERVLCTWLQRLTSKALGAFCFALAGGDPGRAVTLESELFFFRTGTPLPERPIRHYVPESLEGDPTVFVRGFLERVGVLEEFESKLGHLEAVLTVSHDESLSPCLRFALRLLPLVASKRRLCAIDYGSLDELSESQRERLLAELGDRLVLLVTRKAPKELPAGIGHAMVLDVDRVRGIGDADWYASLHQLPPELSPFARSSRDDDDDVRLERDLDDDDDEDEDLD
jgi:hypothetical protein